MWWIFRRGKRLISLREVPIIQASTSGWCRSSFSPASHMAGAELEHLYVDNRVQELLKSLAGCNIEKIHRFRPTNRSEKVHFALMTDSMIKEYISKLEQRTRKFLHFVPFKEPRPNSITILSNDQEIGGFDSSKFIFTDITYDVTNKDRTVVVRETDGTLRLAVPEEHDRMNRVFYDQPDRPVNEPPLFSGKALKEALSRDEHEFILDWATHYFEPDSPRFVELCKHVFDQTCAEGKLDLLHSTRHFGLMAFYLLLNGELASLLNFYALKASIGGAARVIRLWRILFSSWDTTIAQDESDMKIVEGFLNENVDTGENAPNEGESAVHRFSANKLRDFMNFVEFEKGKVMSSKHVPTTI